MNTPSFDAILTGFGGKAVETLRITLGEAWDSLTGEERKDCGELLLALAKAHLYSLAGYDVSGYLKTLDAAFLQWQAVGQQVVASALKSAAVETFGLGGAFAGSALAAFVKSLK